MTYSFVFIDVIGKRQGAGREGLCPWSVGGWNVGKMGHRAVLKLEVGRVLQRGLGGHWGHSALFGGHT